MQIESIVELER